MSFASCMVHMHTCPAATAGVPHVGGPLCGPGAPSVTIFVGVAACMMDNAVCAGPPDMVITCETSVLMEVFGAVRLGDKTAHGGVVAMGVPTVLIGTHTAASAFVEASDLGTPFVRL